MFTRYFTRYQAEQVAEIFRRHERVMEVLLFGSLARRDWGNDIDLILVADKECGGDFIAYAVGFIRADSEYEREYGDHLRYEVLGVRGVRREVAYQNKRLRIYAAEAALAGFRELYEEAQILLRQSGAIDLFVFPPDWREHLDTLQSALPHEDPMFMKNIAREAVKIA